MTTIENETIEYRVRKVERYIVTRFESADRFASCTTKGEFESEMTAYEVASALCKMDHQTKGWPEGDGRIKYPEHPHSIQAQLDGAQVGKPE